MVFNPKKRLTEYSIAIAVKISLGIVLFVFLVGVVYLGIRPYHSHMREGDISLRDAYSPFDFTYTGDVDEKETERLRQEALKTIKPIYSFDSSKLLGADNNISAFFDSVTQSRQDIESIGDDESVGLLRSNSPIKLSDSTLLTFIRAEKIDDIENAVKTAVYSIADQGILDKADSENLLKKEGLKTISIYDPSTTILEEVSVEALLTPQKAQDIAQKEISNNPGLDKRLKKAMTELAYQFLQPNLKFDAELTDKKKEEELSKVVPVRKQILVKKNELLIARGQRISKVHLIKFGELNVISALRGKMSYLVGLCIILAIFLAITVLYLRFYEPKVLKSNKDLFLIATNIVFIASIAEAIALSPWPSYLIPLASVAMLLTILINADVAFLIAILMSIFCGVITGNRFGVTIALLAGSCVGIYASRRVTRRSKLFLAGLLVGTTNLLSIIGIGYLNNLMPSIFLKEGLWGFLNGLLSFFIVIGFLPVLEALFKIPTNITLLELSDLNHPLFREMVMKAPGTYHHSIIVGNLAEAACEAIGANSLLARIGAYYHDIGKIEKPEYFSENESSDNSRHEALNPSMSALVITSHVKDGVELARKHKLNPVIIDFIEQHHGTSLIYYFYQKALEKGLDEKELKEEEFRYPGPKPQTKETAVVLLADSVEASSRTLSNPIPSRIRGLVQRIINNKFIDSQLDDCDLTLKDLNKIAESFVRTLSGVFHTRIEYPKDKNAENRNKKSNGSANSSGSSSEKSNKNGS